MFIGGIENSTDQSPKTTNASKHWQLPNTEIRCFPRETVELSEGKQLSDIGLPPPGIHVLESKEGHHSRHGAEKSSPGELRRPVTRSFLQTEQDTTNGSTESRGDTRRCTACHKVALFSVVSEVTEFAKGGVHTPEAGLSLRDSRSYNGTAMNHRPLLSDWQTTGNRKGNTNDLTKQGFDSYHSRKVDTVEVTLDFRNTGSSRNRFNIDKNRGSKTHQYLDQDKGPKGFQHIATPGFKRATAAGSTVGGRIGHQVVGRNDGLLFLRRGVEQIVDVIEFSGCHGSGGSITDDSYHRLDNSYRKGQDPSLQGTLLARRPPLSTVGKMNLSDVGTPDLGFVRLVVVRLDGQGCFVCHGIVSGFSSSSVSVSSQGARAILVGIGSLGLAVAVVELVIVVVAMTVVQSPIHVPAIVVGVEFDVHQFGGNPALWFAVALSAVVTAHVVVVVAVAVESNAVVTIRGKQRYNLLFVFEIGRVCPA
mmetsp:Transcript_19990/g.49734  ORF Transcript_19990/g.49734 Transcript_19990/m.49734 type:complete len:477 (+) Transcript_19990:5388-6818(+)